MKRSTATDSFNTPLPRQRLVDRPDGLDQLPGAAGIAAGQDRGQFLDVVARGRQVQLVAHRLQHARADLAEQERLARSPPVQEPRHRIDVFPDRSPGLCLRGQRRTQEHGLPPDPQPDQRQQAERRGRVAALGEQPQRIPADRQAVIELVEDHGPRRHRQQLDRQDAVVVPRDQIGSRRSRERPRRPALPFPGGKPRPGPVRSRPGRER